MSIWDSEIFDNDAVVELFNDVESHDADDRGEALADACRIALASDSEDERLAGIAAAVVAAIWAGAPYSSGAILEECSFIREGIGETPEDLLSAAAEVFATLGDSVDESTQTMLEDFAEAVE